MNHPRAWAGALLVAVLLAAAPLGTAAAGGNPLVAGLPNCPELLAVLNANDKCKPFFANVTAAYQNGTDLGVAVAHAAGHFCNSTCLPAFTTALEKKQMMNPGCDALASLPALCAKEQNTPCWSKVAPAIAMLQMYSNPLEQARALNWTMLPEVCSACAQRVAIGFAPFAEDAARLLFGACARWGPNNTPCFADGLVKAVIMDPTVLMTNATAAGMACGNKCLRRLLGSVAPMAGHYLDHLCVRRPGNMTCLEKIVAVNATAGTNNFCATANATFAGDFACCRGVWRNFVAMSGGNVTTFDATHAQCTSAPVTTCPAGAAGRLALNVSIPWDWTHVHADALAQALQSDIAYLTLADDTSIHVMLSRDRAGSLADPVTLASVTIDMQPDGRDDLAMMVEQSLATMAWPMVTMLYPGAFAVTPQVERGSSYNLDPTSFIASCPAATTAFGGRNCSGFSQAMLAAMAGGEDTDPFAALFSPANLGLLCDTGCSAALTAAAATGAVATPRQDCGLFALLGALCTRNSSNKVCGPTVLNTVMGHGGMSDSDSLPWAQLTQTLCDDCGRKVLGVTALVIPEAALFVRLCDRSGGNNNVPCAQDPQLQSLMSMDYTQWNASHARIVCSNSCARKVLSSADPVMAGIIGSLCVQRETGYCLEKVWPLAYPSSQTAQCSALTALAQSDNCCIGVYEKYLMDLYGSITDWTQIKTDCSFTGTITANCRGNAKATRYLKVNAPWSYVKQHLERVRDAMIADLAASLVVSPSTISVTLAAASTTAFHKFVQLQAQGTVANVTLTGSSDQSTQSLATALDQAVQTNSLSLTNTVQAAGGADLSVGTTTAAGIAPPPSPNQPPSPSVGAAAVARPLAPVLVLLLSALLLLAL